MFMKTIKLLLCALLVLPVFVTATAFAVENQHADQPTSSSELTAEEKRKLFEKRIAEQKAKQQKLTQDKVEFVKGRCQAAKSIIAGVQKRVDAFEQKRPDLYGNMVTKLESLGPKLQAAGVDVTDYDKQVAELKTKVKAYDAEVATLKTAVDELADFDCATDPQGFVATIKEGVALRQGVIDKGREIRTYLKDTLRPTLTQIRTELQAAKKEG